MAHGFLLICAAFFLMILISNPMSRCFSACGNALLRDSLYNGHFKALVCPQVPDILGQILLDKQPSQARLWLQPLDKSDHRHVPNSLRPSVHIGTLTNFDVQLNTEIRPREAPRDLPGAYYIPDDSCAV